MILNKTQVVLIVWMNTYSKYGPKVTPTESTNGIPNILECITLFVNTVFIINTVLYNQLILCSFQYKHSIFYY